MSQQIFLDCPHCFAIRVGMDVVGKRPTKRGPGSVFAQCNRCSEPVSAIVSFKNLTMQQWLSDQRHIVGGDDGTTIEAVFPAKNATTAPDHVDSGLARIFVQAEDARKRGDYHISGMGLRKTLDIALKVFDSTLKGDLYNRIDALAARHDITPAMKEWAHQIRLIGNEAAHEADEPSKEDIDAMSSFTETLLKYLFTLPAEVKTRAKP